MNFELKQRLVPALQQSSNQPIFKGHTDCANRPANRSLSNVKQIRTVTVITLVLVFTLYRLLYRDFSSGCISDLTHEWSSSLNALLNQSRSFYNWWVGVAQEVIEVQILLITVVATLRVANLRVHMLIACFYGVRAVFLVQNIQKLPYPSGIVWSAPAVPSFTVPYGITRDFFYSGHSGLMVICILFWRRLGYRRLEFVTVGFAFHVVLVLLSTRVHYSIDVVAAVVVALWMDVYVGRYVRYFDMMFSWVIERMEGMGNYIRRRFIE